MKRKTEIEDKLLFEINKNFQENINDIEYIKNTFTQINSTNSNYESNKYYNIDKLKQQNKSNLDIQIKFFEYPNTIYSIFQYFYLKRKNYMGMNLTGLIQGKMETGLGFRSNIIKIAFQSIKDVELKNIINEYFSDLNYDTKLENINVYKINSNGFKWSDYGYETHKYIYLIANLSIQKYFFILEK